MPSYIAKTNENWVEFLKEEGITDSVNFWSPTANPLLKSLPNNRLFLFSKCPPDNKRMLVGYGKVREYFQSTVGEVWRTLALCNGVSSLDEFIERINSFSSVSQTRNQNTVIGNTIMDEVVWLDQPVKIENMGVTVAPNIVRGRSLSIAEETTLLDGYGDTPTQDNIRQLLATLNDQYRTAPANRKLSVSNRIERNPLLVKLLKQLHSKSCQLCGESFFWKRGQLARYSEVHHIKELSVGGRDAADNCLVLCANCHKKMHYGDISIEDHSDTLVITENIGSTITVAKNIIR